MPVKKISRYSRKENITIPVASMEENFMMTKSELKDSLTLVCILSATILEFRFLKCIVAYKLEYSSINKTQQNVWNELCY